MKHRIVHTLQKYLLNPRSSFCSLSASRPRVCAPGNHRSYDREARCTPVGDARIGNHFWIVAEHGMNAGYLRNLLHHPRVRLKRDGILARWHTGTGMCSRMMIRASGSAGSLVSCPAA